MNPLPLSPLPSETREESHSFRRIESEGFLDEQVVSRVIARGAYDRFHAVPDGMVLSSCGDDYAGWALPMESPFRKMADAGSVAFTATRLPGSPSLRNEPEAGIDAPYVGRHRWWLFGLSGAISCGIIALTLLSLAQRREIAEITGAPFPAQKHHERPAADAGKSAIQPSLTRVLPAER